jgi:membrane-associated protease RseP (regulator of RpoE activity)
MAFGLSVLVFVVSLFAIIMIHEGGHYLAARRFNFRVLEYFLGFGPKLWSIRRGEIEYGVKAIPAGGYVKIAGMNPFENDVPPGDEDRAYTAKPVWQRIVVILCGPLSHFLVAGILFTILLATVGDGHAAQIDAIAPRVSGQPSPAAIAGLRPGDLIVQIGDVQNPSQTEIGDVLSTQGGRATELVVERDGQQIAMTISPIKDWDLDPPRWRFGISMGPVPRPVPSAIVHGFGQLGTMTVQSVQGISRAFGPAGISRMVTLLTHPQEERNETDTSSLIGVGGLVGNMGAKGEWAQFLFVFAYVTLFIGIVNLIPLPPLDGGHVALALIEKVRGKAIDMKKVVPVSATVLAVLGFLSISAMVLDVWKPIPAGP